MIIVDPLQDIVAIRMISHESHNGPNDNFDSFREMVLNLSK